VHGRNIFARLRPRDQVFSFLRRLLRERSPVADILNGQIAGTATMPASALA
jgi:hypothetical protein